MNGQASESLLHAQQAGEIITGLGGHPSQRIASIEETNNHDVKPILQESLEHEMNALNLYRSLLEEVSKFYNNNSSKLQITVIYSCYNYQEDQKCNT